MKPEIRARLKEMSEPGYAKFTGGLTPGAENILGVRLPLIRQYAKELAAAEGESALEGEDHYYEEKLLRGILIGTLKVDIDRRFELMRDFIPVIDNWAVCDSFCSSLKVMKKQQEHCLEFITPYAFSEEEFRKRFAAVMLLGYFVDEKYIDNTLGLLTRINTDEYYSSMGVAWALADCYIKFPEKTLPVLRAGLPDADTNNRAIRKICESLRVQPEDKQMLKALMIK